MNNWRRNCCNNYYSCDERKNNMNSNKSNSKGCCCCFCKCEEKYDNQYENCGCQEKMPQCGYDLGHSNQECDCYNSNFECNNYYGKY